MQIKNFTVTLAASAAAITSEKVYCRQVYIQPDVTNSNPMYVGGSGLTTSNGLRIEGYDSDGLPSAPFPLVMSRDNPLLASEIYVVGTAGQIARVMLVTE